LFEEYNHPSSGHIELFCEKYETWQLGAKFRHMAYYYNMSIGRTVYINGIDHDQMELADDDPIGFLIGFGNSFPTCIKKRIENTRS
jgi:hypothetical protein